MLNTPHNKLSELQTLHNHQTEELKNNQENIQKREKIELKLNDNIYRKAPIGIELAEKFKGTFLILNISHDKNRLLIIDGITTELCLTSKTLRCQMR